MKYLKISLYNLSFLIFNKKKGACSQFIYSCVCRAPCCAFSVKNHGVSVNSLALSSVFRYICYIKYQFLSNTGLSKQDRWTTAQEFYLSLRFPSIPSSFLLSPPVSRQIYLIYLFSSFHLTSQKSGCRRRQLHLRPSKRLLASRLRRITAPIASPSLKSAQSPRRCSPPSHLR